MLSKIADGGRGFILSPLSQQIYRIARIKPYLGWPPIRSELLKFSSQFFGLCRPFTVQSSCTWGRLGAPMPIPIATQPFLAMAIESLLLTRLYYHSILVLGTGLSHGVRHSRNSLSGNYQLMKTQGQIVEFSARTTLCPWADIHFSGVTQHHILGGSISCECLKAERKTGAKRESQQGVSISNSFAHTVACRAAYGAALSVQPQGAISNPPAALG